MQKVLEKLRKARENPRRAFMFMLYRSRGHYYKLKFRLLNRNVKIGRNFYVRGSLRIKGPGRVRIGNNVEIDRGNFPVTPYTNNSDAEILVGDGAKLRAVRFSCCQRIEIGDGSMLAECRILDTDFHSINPYRRNDPTAIKESPVKIGKNVWIGTDCFIMRGVTVGDNATIAAGSVVYSQTQVPAFSVFGGNPATLIKKLDMERLNKSK